jgi:hypothetical protein
MLLEINVFERPVKIPGIILKRALIAAYNKLFSYVFSNVLIYFTHKTIVKMQSILSKRAMPHKKRVKRAKRDKLWGTSD